MAIGGEKSTFLRAQKAQEARVVWACSRKNSSVPRRPPLYCPKWSRKKQVVSLECQVGERQATGKLPEAKRKTPRRQPGHSASVFPDFPDTSRVPYCRQRPAFSSGERQMPLQACSATEGRDYPEEARGGAASAGVLRHLRLGGRGKRIPRRAMASHISGGF